jgi:hypothetical protein
MGMGREETVRERAEKIFSLVVVPLVTTVILSNLNSPTQCLLMSSRILYMNAMRELYYIIYFLL